MSILPAIFRTTLLSVFLISTGLAAQEFEPEPPIPMANDPYVPTPQRVVDAMLAMAQIDSDDVIYDLGCGDGRMVVTAVKDFGAKQGVGVDIDPERIAESRENAEEADVADKTEFIEASFFDVDFSDATVMALYLLPDTLEKLRPEFEAQLEPGTRIVTHDFRIAGWEPVAEKQVPTPEDAVSSGTIYLWEVPEKDAGT